MNSTRCHILTRCDEAQFHLIIFLMSHKDYEHPDIRSSVHAMIAAEMKTFKPRDYLAHLSMPDIRVKSALVEVNGVLSVSHYL